jgi:hypothetical protein
MDIHFSGHITQNDFVQAVQMHYRRQIYLFILPGLIYVPVVIYITKILSKQYLSPIFGIFIALVAIIFLYYQLFHSAPKKAYKNPQNFYLHPFEGQATEENICFNNYQMNMNFLWSSFIQYYVKGNMVLLYQNKNCFNILTRSQFANEADWLAFLELVNKKVSSKQKKNK